MCHDSERLLGTPLPPLLLVQLADHGRGSWSSEDGSKRGRGTVTDPMHKHDDRRMIRPGRPQDAPLTAVRLALDQAPCRKNDQGD